MGYFLSPGKDTFHKITLVTTHSLIIRIWLEETAVEDDGSWRGYIIRIPRSASRYLKDLNDITTFIVPHF